MHKHGNHVFCMCIYAQGLCQSWSFVRLEVPACWMVRTKASGCTLSSSFVAVTSLKMKIISFSLVRRIDQSLCVYGRACVYVALFNLDRERNGFLQGLPVDIPVFFKLRLPFCVFRERAVTDWLTSWCWPRKVIASSVSGLCAASLGLSQVLFSHILQEGFLPGTASVV
jgi:hypothetical protein